MSFLQPIDSLISPERIYLRHDPVARSIYEGVSKLYRKMEGLNNFEDHYVKVIREIPIEGIFEDTTIKKCEDVKKEILWHMKNMYKFDEATSQKGLTHILGLVHTYCSDGWLRKLCIGPLWFPNCTLDHLGLGVPWQDPLYNCSSFDRLD